MKCRKIAGILMAALLALGTLAVPAFAQGDSVTEPNSVAKEVDAEKWELIDPASIADANGTAGGNVKLMVLFTEALADGYELEINFTTAGGVTKTYTASSSVKPMKYNFTCLPIRDMFDKLKLGGETLTSVTITGRSAGSIMKVDYVTGLVTTSGTPVSGDDANPHTGAGDFTAAAVLAAVSGAAALIAYKKKD